MLIIFLPANPLTNYITFGSSNCSISIVLNLNMEYRGIIMIGFETPDPLANAYSGFSD